LLTATIAKEIGGAIEEVARAIDVVARAIEDQ